MEQSLGGCYLGLMDQLYGPYPSLPLLPRPMRDPTLCRPMCRAHLAPPLRSDLSPPRQPRHTLMCPHLAGAHPTPVASASVTWWQQRRARQRKQGRKAVLSSGGLKGPGGKGFGTSKPKKGDREKEQKGGVFWSLFNDFNVFQSLLVHGKEHHFSPFTSLCFSP